MPTILDMDDRAATSDSPTKKPDPVKGAQRNRSPLFSTRMFFISSVLLERKLSRFVVGRAVRQPDLPLQCGDGINACRMSGFQA